MDGCPYSDIPEHAWWDKAVVGSPTPIGPIIDPKFRIDRNTRIATSGSCFAQHLGRYLKFGGHHFFVAETAPDYMNADERRLCQYEIFSIRSGNIYTSRALLQLLERAYGIWDTEEPAWKDNDRFLDPMRPRTQPGGYLTTGELEHDQKNHLSAVRTMVEDLDVFAFTLGLTEMWERKSDGTAFPVCPGCGVGEFNEDLYQFKNMSVNEVIHDLEKVTDLIKGHNSGARVLFTVSPVPLIASYSGKHVLEASHYSKSVLRVAAETLRNSHPDIDYLPSYEMITSGSSQGKYFAEDLRSVTEDGVRHVMRNFFNAYSEDSELFESTRTNSSVEPHADAQMPDATRAASAEEAADVICDEETLNTEYNAIKN